MNDKKILDHINNSINDAPINILDNIKNAKIVKMTEHDEITRQEVQTNTIKEKKTIDIKTYKEGQTSETDNIRNSKKNKLKFNTSRTLISLASFAAVFLLVFTGFYQFRVPDSQIYLDINPSIQITTNKRDKVIELIALNEDSITIIDDIDYKDKDLEEVTGELMKSIALESIVSKSHIGDEKSVLLVSVYNEDSNKGDEQAAKLDKLVRERIDSYNLHPVILTQSIDKSNTVEKFAKEYGISVGKMTFIRNLIILNQELKTEDLVKLSLYELLEMSINTGIDIDRIVNSGNDERVHTPPSSEATTEEATTTPSTQIEETRDDNDDYVDDDKDSSQATSKPTPAPTKESRRKISTEEARRIALSKTNGGRIVDADQDDDEFEFEIINGNIKYDVELNLYGDITDFDSETIDDDDYDDDDDDD